MKLFQLVGKLCPDTVPRLHIWNQLVKFTSYCKDARLKVIFIDTAATGLFTIGKWLKILVTFTLTEKCHHLLYKAIEIPYKKRCHRFKLRGIEALSFHSPLD